MVSINDLSRIPHSPGCYLFKDKEGRIIYVGKANSLRKRVTSYFQKNFHDEKTSMLIQEIKDIDFIATSNEVEALLLENRLIKKHYPKYNIDLKDSQRYAYLCLTDAPLPWIETERTRVTKGEYFGPFVSGAIRKIIVDVLSRNFKILTKKPSPQLRKAIDKETYSKRVAQARKILKGKVDELISDLEKEMESASGKTYYEYALSLRNQIKALETLKQKQLIEQTRSVDANIINYLISGDEVFLLVFSIRKGVLEGKQEYVFPYKEDFLDEFLLQYYDTSPIPQELILPINIDPSLKDYLLNKRGRAVKVIIPEIGDKKQLLELVLKNILATFFAGKERLIELQKALSLPKLPINMECFDISHLSGTNTVASMVSFQGGMPNKTNYRKFKINTTDIGDDYAAMREVLTRRYSGSLAKSMRNPDLIIIDGGPGQLSTALKVIKELRINIPIISIAKQFEEIYTTSSKEPIVLPKKHKGLTLLQAIRDEAHRFAISYQRLLRRKEIN